ncbi:MAG: TIGR02587 family membrane protein [Cyanophyceae cyanobacterium]
MKKQDSAWKHELDDLIRAACGGFLFGIPLLYTMEVWWISSSVSPPLMLITIAVTWVVLFFLNRTEGFRKINRVSRLDAAKDSVEAIAIGIVCAALALVLLREITLQTQLSEALGKLIFESVPFALGATLANQFLSNNNNNSNPPKRNHHNRSPRLNDTLADVGATLIGALLIAFNIAPTDEIPMLVAAVSGPWLLAVVAASLLISYAIVFQARFANQLKRRQQIGIFQHPLSETVMCYLVSLAAAVAMLWFFQRLGPSDPWAMWLRQTLLLGLPATVGGAAGRLAI